MLAHSIHEGWGSQADSEVQPEEVWAGAWDAQRASLWKTTPLGVSEGKVVKEGTEGSFTEV